MNGMPSPTLLHGISLVQSGRRAEALQFLRLAARSEALSADAWLWIAAATDDIDEYRGCVAQALRLDPYHPVAVRMQQELDRQMWAAPQVPMAAPRSAPIGPQQYTRQDTAWRMRPSRLRRVLRALALALLIGGCLGPIAALFVTGAVPNLVRDWLHVQDLHTLEFAVGATPAYRFRVQVPEAWLPANAESATWQARRAALETALPGSAALWDALQVDFSTVVRDPAYGTLWPLAHIIETDADRLRQGGLAGALTLHEIVPLPVPPAGTDTSICARMRLLEAQAQTEQALIHTPGGALLETYVVRRAGPGDCATWVHRRFGGLPPNQAIFVVPGMVPPAGTREILVAVPVGAERAAIWTITVPDATYDDDYAAAVKQILATLEYRAD